MPTLSGSMRTRCLRVHYRASGDDMLSGSVLKAEARVVRSRRRQGFGEVAFEGAGEQAVQHAVRDAPSEANDDRSVAADGIASTRPLADDRVGDDSSCLLGGQPF